MIHPLIPELRTQSWELTTHCQEMANLFPGFQDRRGRASDTGLSICVVPIDRVSIHTRCVP